MQVSKAIVQKSVESTLLRAVRMQTKAREIEASLLSKVKVGVDNPAVTNALAECREIDRDCESLIERAAAFVAKIDVGVESLSPN